MGCGVEPGVVQSGLGVTVAGPAGAGRLVCSEVGKGCLGLECEQCFRLGWVRELVLRQALSPVSPQSGGSDQERTKKKRRGDRYSVQTSLIVATLKKMLPIGLNMCAPTDQELITLAKGRYALVLIQPCPATP